MSQNGPTMTQRQPDKRRKTSGGAPRPGATARAVSTTRELLTAIARVILLVIMVGAALRAVSVLLDIVVRPSVLGTWPHAPSYVAFVLAAVSIVLMLALALNSSFLADRVFAPSRLGTLFVVVWATGGGAIVIALIGSYQLGVYVAIEILPAAMAFALMGLVSPGLFRRPGNARPAAGGDDTAPASSPPEHARQRRGGRTKR